jgi:hypothetical protein
VRYDPYMGRSAPKNSLLAVGLGALYGSNVFKVKISNKTSLSWTAVVNQTPTILKD